MTEDAPFKEAEVVGQSKGIAWVRRSDIGFWPALWQTWKHIIFQPKDFFEKMPTRGGLASPFFFWAIFGIIQIVIGVGLGFLLLLVPEEAGLPRVTHNAVLTGAVFQAVLLPVALFAWAGIYHLIILAFGGRGGFEATFRVICFSSAVMVFMLAPVIGVIFAAIYMLVLYFLGFRKVHNFTTAKSLVVVLLAIVIAVLLQNALGRPGVDIKRQMQDTGVIVQ